MLAKLDGVPGATREAIQAAQAAVLAATVAASVAASRVSHLSTNRLPDPSDLRVHPDRISPFWSISVSPDGEWVAFSDHASGQRVKRMRTDGTELVDLGAPGGSHTPRWSPEGALISIQNEEAIHVIPASGGSAVDVSSAATADDGGCADTERGMLRNHGFTGDGRITFDNHVCRVGHHRYSGRAGRRTAGALRSLSGPDRNGRSSCSRWTVQAAPSSRPGMHGPASVGRAMGGLPSTRARARVWPCSSPTRRPAW